MLFKISKLILLFVVATVFHWAAATLFSFWGMSVNVMLVFAIACCALLPMELGYPVAFLCGLFLDFFGTKLFGNNAFSFTLAAILVYNLRERLDFETFVPQLFTVLGLTLLVGLLNAVLTAWFTPSMVWPGVWGLLGGAVAGAFFAPSIFWAVRFLLCGPKHP